MTHDDPVARYYDSNTGRFLLVGGGGDNHSIHRQLWGPGVQSVADAADYINHLLADEVRERHPDTEVTILDLGCGVGGTLFRLAELLPASRLHGITISRRQFETANRIAAEKGLEDRCRFYLGDFQTKRVDVHADVILAVESFVHSDSPEHFFECVMEQLRDGGHLLLADDFLSGESHGLDDGQKQHLEAFKAGWRVPSVCTAQGCISAAAACDLSPIADTDLTPLVRLGRIRDRLISLLSPLFQLFGLTSLPFFGNMIGGNALQTGLRDGWLSYRLLIFRKGPVGS